jgi:oligopeptide/dipeptide ABC transporter ATP-binding protein
MSLLEAHNLVKQFPARGGGAPVRAVDNVSLQIARGETLGLVGESGCGKSTLGRLLLRLLEPDNGFVRMEGQPVYLPNWFFNPPVRRPKVNELGWFRRRAQIVFQDPFRSLNPRLTVGQAIAEPLIIHRIVPRGQTRERVAQLLNEVGLDPAVMDRYPHQFSGGQRQRIGIARALAVEPQLIVLDEPVSALDVSVQAQIVQLLQKLQREHSLSYLFISHNLAVVRHMAQRVAVMYLGAIVETAPVAQLYATPRHPYTRALLQAVPDPDPSRIVAPPVEPLPLSASSTACRYAPRCALARRLAQNGDVPARCLNEVPPLREIESGHFTACHFSEEMRNETAAN